MTHATIENLQTWAEDWHASSIKELIAIHGIDAYDVALALDLVSAELADGVTWDDAVAVYRGRFDHIMECSEPDTGKSGAGNLTNHNTPQHMEAI
jgi:hypothetical protein